MDIDVREHLREVVRALRADTPDPGSRRAAMLDRLEAYAEAGRYPRWDRPVRRRPRRTRPPRCFDAPGARSPRFRDPDGTWCAVGHLVAATAPALADDLARRFEPCWLDEIDDPRVAAWAAAHGSTTDELAWIQPSYCWQPPVCDDVVVEEAAPVDPSEEPCAGADPRIQRRPDFCQDCDGPFRVWVTVENVGHAPAEMAVELWGPSYAVVDRVEGVAVGAQEAVQVELTTDSVEVVGMEGGVRLVPASDCHPAGNEYPVWDMGNGGPGWVLPDECGGDGCDTGHTVPVGRTCGGCVSPGPVTPWGLLVATGLIAGRARRRR